MSHPDLAELPRQSRELLASLAQVHTVCLISGRELEDLSKRVNLPNLYYAGDHGCHIVGPAGSDLEFRVSPVGQAELAQASHELKQRLLPIQGVVLETKETSLSVHYRLVGEEDRPLVHQMVQEVAESTPGLHLRPGKMVHELRPKLPWNKGRAVLWLLQQLGLQKNDACPICLGDDRTDEDMFTVVRGWGIAIVVGRPGWPTAADYFLADYLEVAQFLRTFVATQEAPWDHVV